MNQCDDFHYRAASEDDIAALVRLLPATLPGNWSPQALSRLLQQHQLRVLENRGSGQLVAFAEFRVVLDEAELMSLAVDPAWQRKGLGGLILVSVLREAAGLSVNRMLLEVRESNLAARSLYERNGFRQDGKRPQYYASLVPGAPREAACLYSLELESLSRD